MDLSEMMKRWGELVSNKLTPEEHNAMASNYESLASHYEDLAKEARRYADNHRVLASNVR